MLAIRMQRTGRSGHAQFRVVVQDSRFNPKSGRVVAYLGSYDPHTKNSTLDGQKASKFLDNGAQPSERVTQLLQKEGIDLPKWVQTAQPKKSAVRKPDKRRSTRPAEQKPAPEAKAPGNDTQPEPEQLTEAAPEAESTTETETTKEES